MPSASLLPDLRSSSAPALFLGYLVALALVGQYLSELTVLGNEAAPVGSIRWRFAITGITFVSMKWLLVGLGAALASAVILNHRLMLKALSTVGWLVVGLAGVALVIYALDFLQLRLAVADAGQRRFTTISLRSGVSAIGAIVVVALMARAAWRISARDTRFSGKRRSQPSG